MRLSLVGMFLCVFCASAVHAGPLDADFWKTDKQKHYVISAAVSSASYILLRRHDYGYWESLVTGVALGVLVGTAKEIIDRHVDSDDIKADAVGGMSGAGFCLVLDLAFF